MKKERKYYLHFILIFLLLGISFAWSICSGSSIINLSNVLNSFTDLEKPTIYSEIILNHRFPKALTAILCGISLSICGLMMQTLFRNPLAGPYILGINSGASLFVACIMTGASFIEFDKNTFVFSGSIVFFACAGASFTLIIILGISRKIKSNVTLLLTGIMLSYIYGALQNLLEYFSNPNQLKSFITWEMGSIGNVTWNDLKIFAPITIIGLLMSILLVKPLNLFLLGDNYAQTSGLNIKKTKWKIILICGLLVGVSTAYCGPIAFIGLAIPHLARIIFQTNNHTVILPSSALIGASTLLICDSIGNILPNNVFIPINVTTSLIGAPIVIWLLYKNKNLST